MVTLVYGLIEAGEHGWGSAGALLEILAGLVVLAGFFAWERRLGRAPAGRPLVDVQLFRSRSYTWA